MSEEWKAQYNKIRPTLVLGDRCSGKLRGNPWSQIMPLRMSGFLPHDLCHGWDSSCWLPASFYASVRAHVVWTSSWHQRRPCLGFFVDLPFWSSRRRRSGWGLGAVSCHFWPNAFRVTVPWETSWGGRELGERWGQCLCCWGWDGSCWVSLCTHLVLRCPLLYPLGPAVGLGTIS